MLRISTKYSDGTLTLALFGELDHHEAAETMELCRCAVDRFTPRKCELDMSALSFMDSSGIAVIIRLKKMLCSYRAELVLVCPSKQADRVIRASGIDRLIAIKNGRKEREKSEIH